MRLYNTLSRKIEEFEPAGEKVTLYSCGPTVYDSVHIGNWRAFVFADTLRRVLGLKWPVKHALNITDVDDKTIHRSIDEKVDLESVTKRYEKLFLEDSEKIGNDLSGTKVIRATEEIGSMKELIGAIFDAGLAYAEDDGVYFSISKYAEKYPYGVLSNVPKTPESARHRIDNDEYEKTDARDFALWKRSDEGEPSWELEIGGKVIKGRPGWHIECSAMSAKYLGQPFDIHTGGIDLVFPHHENEIAQSKAATGVDLANFFLHNEHLLVDGAKMSKSKNNFHTLEDVVGHGHHPLALRLLYLQAHYRSQQNFSGEALQAAENFLINISAFADRQFQDDGSDGADELAAARRQIQAALEDDLNTPAALAELGKLIDLLDAAPLDDKALQDFLEFIDSVFGLSLLERSDIEDEEKELIRRRESARTEGDYEEADKLRDKLGESGLEISDTPTGPRWRRTKLS